MGKEQIQQPGLKAAIREVEHPNDVVRHEFIHSFIPVDYIYRHR